eukprot:GILI01019967.1.p1 GENE.GILI01019967.1~~GILI01019967.1.p1  ORF type:complete len:105 (+),score=6.19 GILI01019967.1:32-316(+)
MASFMRSAQRCLSSSVSRIRSASLKQVPSAQTRISSKVSSRSFSSLSLAPVESRIVMNTTRIGCVGILQNASLLQILHPSSFSLVEVSDDDDGS